MNQKKCGDAVIEEIDLALRDSENYLLRIRGPKNLLIENFRPSLGRFYLRYHRIPTRWPAWDPAADRCPTALRKDQHQ